MGENLPARAGDTGAIPCQGGFECAQGQLSPGATTAAREPQLPRPLAAASEARTPRSPRTLAREATSEKPKPCKGEQSPPTAARKTPECSQEDPGQP